MNCVYRQDSSLIRYDFPQWLVTIKFKAMLKFTVGIFPVVMDKDILRLQVELGLCFHNKLTCTMSLKAKNIKYPVVLGSLYTIRAQPP